MKKAFLISLLVLALAAGVILFIAPAQTSANMCGYNRWTAAGLMIQVSLSWFTLLALVGSLFGKELRLHYSGPRVKLISAVDEMHCVLSENQTGRGGSLRIYAHLTNGGGMVAEDSQLITDRIYVSVDGRSYDLHQTLIPASYKWIYSSARCGADPYVASVRRSADRYVRVVEIAQRSSEIDSLDSGRTIRDVGSLGTGPASWLEVCLPPSEGRKPNIIIPAKYRSVLIPILIVVKDCEEQMAYVRIHWKGETIQEYRDADMLDISIITEPEAKKLIRKEA